MLKCTNFNELYSTLNMYQDFRYSTEMTDQTANMYGDLQLMISSKFIKIQSNDGEFEL